MTFADRLSSVMEENGLNSLRVSKEIGLSDSLIGCYAKGSKVPNLKNALLLADFFGVSLDYLVGRTDVREVGIKKEPAPGMSENGREMLELYEQLPEREQLLLLGRLQEMTAPVLGEGKGGAPSAEPSAGRAV